MPNSKKLSVIIVTYNDLEHLKICISSIYEKFSQLSAWEIILVNNDKKQKIADLSVDFSKIKVIDHGENVGFGRAMNMGAKKAEGEFLLIFNPDTEVISENIAGVLNEFEKDKKIGIIGGGIFNRDGGKQQWSAGKEISFYDLVRNNLGFSRSKEIWNSEKKIACDWVAGTTMLVKKEFFQELGGFDESFFMYFEDMDLCHRARKLGKKVVFFPDFKIYHGNGQSYTDKRLQKSHYYDSMEKYFKKHSNFFVCQIVRIIRKFIIRK